MPQFEFINSLKASDFSEAYSIYLEAFPVEERHSYRTIEKRIQSRQGQMLVGKVDKEIISMAILWDFDDCSFSLLEYFAVKKSWRGKSIGSKFLDYLSKTPQFRERVIIAEVEDPEYGEDSSNKINRLRFYFNNNFLLLDGIRSLVPPIKGDHSTPVLLMVHSNKKRKQLSRHVVENLIRIIYSDIYNIRDGELILEKIINQLPGTIHLVSNYSI